ncbi:MAG: MTH938/NDUFAF3 family protein [Gammaproteobacteria bacterium]|nr:MTH938/NDUFAF3 family protein [Gammaproteobacteria bacterium]
MQISQDYNTSAYTFRSYQAGKAQVFAPLGDNVIISPDTASAVATVHTLEHSFWMLPQKLVEQWEPRSLDELTAAHLAPLLDEKPELLILGTGEKIRFPKQEITQILTSRRIGVEVMGNSAACRTYNFLISDRRRVAIAILID